MQRLGIWGVKQKIAESVFPGAFPDAQSWNLSLAGRLVHAGLNWDTIYGPYLGVKCLHSEGGLLRNVMTVSDTRFYTRRLSLPCSTYKSPEHPLLFESCVSDISVMNRVEAVRDTGPQILLEVGTRRAEPWWCFDGHEEHQNGPLGWTCFLRDWPLHLHICFQWRTTLGRSLMWTCPCWVQNLCPRAASEDSNLYHRFLRIQFSSGLDASRLQGLVLSAPSSPAAGDVCQHSVSLCTSPKSLRKVNFYQFNLLLELIPSPLSCKDLTDLPDSNILLPFPLPLCLLFFSNVFLTFVLFFHRGTHEVNES